MGEGGDGTEGEVGPTRNESRNLRGPRGGTPRKRVRQGRRISEEGGRVDGSGKVIAGG